MSQSPVVAGGASAGIPEKTALDGSPVHMPLAGHIDELRLEDCARCGSLPSPDWSDVRLHLEVCPACRDRLEEMGEFVSFMRAVPDETAGHLHRRHTTAAGTVFLVVSGSDAGAWEGRVIGCGWDIVRTFRRGAQAKAWLEQWYDQTLPPNPDENRWS